jgi:hypothetical protein
VPSSRGAAAEGDGATAPCVIDGPMLSASFRLVEQASAHPSRRTNCVMDKPGSHKGLRSFARRDPLRKPSSSWNGTRQTSIR